VLKFKNKFGSLRVKMPQICGMGRTALLPFRKKAC
jgi:hypothetical protein